MPVQKGDNRNQLQLLNLEELVSEDSDARLIDLYVETIDPEQLGFEQKGKSHEGRPALAAKYLIGLYLYSYMNKCRSSRKIEKAAKLNIELWWLLDNQKPSYKTIADFRKDNPGGMLNLFAHFRDFCASLDLYGKKLVAIDGAKIRAQNSKKNNYNKKKIERQLDYSKAKIKQYLSDLDKNDALTDKEQEQIKSKLSLARKSVNKYEILDKKLEQSQEDQISIVDEDARSLMIKRNIVEVGYNVQSSVDAKNNLIAHIDVTNQQDKESLSNMSIKTKQNLNIADDELTVLADKGYYSGAEISKCHSNGIDTLVAIPKNSHPTKDPDFQVGKFIYDEQKDVLLCPANQTLTTSGKVLSKKDKKRTVKYKRYSLSKSVCFTCPFKDKCLSKNQRGGKHIERKLSQKALDRNKEQVKQRRQEYMMRQAIVEHPFGTIKRSWGYTYTLVKGIEKVRAEVNLIGLCYNFRRVINILGEKALMEVLKEKIRLNSSYLALMLVTTIGKQQEWKFSKPYY